MPHSTNVDLDDKQLTAVQSTAQDAYQEIWRIYETHQAVAIGDYHWNDISISYAINLVQYPEFANTVQDIVVEFGNALYQKDVDDYISGRSDDIESIDKALRGSLYFTAWMPEVYRNFFKTVRDVNSKLPGDRQIKVHLAEAKFDWRTQKDAEQWQHAASTKGERFYEVTSALLDENKNVLMIFGAFHLINVPENYRTSQPQSKLPLATRLKQHYPDSLYTLWPVTEPVFVDSLNAVPTPSILPIKGSPLAGLEFRDLLPKARFKLAEMGNARAKTEGLFDAFLYTGANQRVTIFPEYVVKDDLWVEEMTHRLDLIGGKMKDKFSDILSESRNHYQ